MTGEVPPKQVSVVIPTLESEPLTLESVPDDVETVVVSEGNRAEARNIGARRTNGDVLVFCDDDIAFEERVFWEQVERARPGLIIGLTDFDFGLLLTRFFVVVREDFGRLGGFDERLNHMEDTEFCLRALAAGLNLDGLPKDSVYHEGHESAGQGWGPTVKNTAYLCVKYPRWAPYLIQGVLS